MYRQHVFPLKHSLPVPRFDQPIARAVIRAQAVGPNAETGSTDWSPLRPNSLIPARAAKNFRQVGNPATIHRHAGVSWKALLSEHMPLWSFNSGLGMLESTWASNDRGSIYSEVSRLEIGRSVGVEV